jgi:hypothetical protein
MMIPKDVFSSAAAGSTRTLSARGLMLTFAIRDKRFVVKIRSVTQHFPCQRRKKPKKTRFTPKTYPFRDKISARNGKKLTRVSILPTLLDSDFTITYIQYKPTGL